MARMIPAVFPFPGEPRRFGERTVFDKFRQLPDGWTIIYSQSWHGERHGRTDDGEGDFLLLHARHGFFVAEVKGGRKIYLEEGNWFSIPHGSNDPKSIRDPFEQSLSTATYFDEYLREKLPHLRLPRFGHFVVFPGHTQKRPHVAPGQTGDNH